MTEVFVLNVSAVSIRGFSHGVEVKLILVFQREVLIGLSQKFVILYLCVSMREQEGVHSRHKVFELIR